MAKFSHTCLSGYKYCVWGPTGVFLEMTNINEVKIPLISGNVQSKIGKL